MTQMKVLEVNGRSAGEREEHACECGCGCGMGVTPQPPTEARGKAQLSSVESYKGLYRGLLGEPYGRCGTRRFS